MARRARARRLKSDVHTRAEVGHASVGHAICCGPHAAKHAVSPYMSCGGMRPASEGVFGVLREPKKNLKIPTFSAFPDARTDADGPY